MLGWKGGRSGTGHGFTWAGSKLLPLVEQKFCLAMCQIFSKIASAYKITHPQMETSLL